MDSNHKFQRLLEPGRIGRMKLKNRIVLAAVGTDFGSDDGYVTERSLGYYEARARGGAGLVTVAYGSIDHPRGKGMFRQLGINDDKFLPGLTKLAQVIHRHGAKAAIQLHHGGRKAYSFFAENNEPVAPSPIPMTAGEMPRELTLEEIARLVELYAQAAERVKKAGFDGVEVHGAHGYLIAQFLSGEANKRQDAYGGSLENRARFLVEIIKAVKDKVGPTYPVWCRLNGMEFEIPEGITRQEAKETARMAEAAGADAIHVSGYGDSTTVHFTDGPIVHKAGNLLPLASGIKKVVNVPVIAVGRISPEMGERALREGKADFIAMARQLIADPDMPNKLASGNVQDIRRCIFCDVCVNQLFSAQPVCCAINAAAGRENELKIEPAKRVKKVVVVGGGPGGMEAARVAALRGHRVVLYEKERWLGGELFYAAILQDEMEDLIRYLKGQMRKLGVKVKVGTEVTPTVVEKVNPDVCIVAVGAVPVTPQIPGAGSRKVITTSQLWRKIGDCLEGNSRASRKKKRSFLTEFTKPGARVAIVGGNLIGCLLASFLAENGREVSIVESGQMMPRDMTTTHGWIVMHSLEQMGVAILAGAECEEVTRKGLTITTQEGQRRIIEADTIVLVDDNTPNGQLLEAMKGKVTEVYAAGDCVERVETGLPKEFIKEAIAQAHDIALKI